MYTVREACELNSNRMNLFYYFGSSLLVLVYYIRNVIQRHNFEDGLGVGRERRRETEKVVLS